MGKMEVLKMISRILIVGGNWKNRQDEKGKGLVFWLNSEEFSVNRE